MVLLKDDHIYSYSQLASVSECPYMFYLERIEKVKTLSNGFAERGTLIHDIIDQWAKGVLTKEQMPTEYERRYANEVTTAFPVLLASKGYTEKAYKTGFEYFANFDEFAGYKILATEEKFKIDLPLTDGSTRPFVGIIDMVLQDELTDELIICDHKSKSKASFRKAEDEMDKQHLSDSRDTLTGMFNENGMKPERPFIDNDYNAAMQWATEMVYRIESFEILDWLETKEQDFFCENICACRRECTNGVSKTYKKSKA